MKYNDTKTLTNQSDYTHHFWNLMRGSQTTKEKITQGRSIDTGAYFIPSCFADKYEKAIVKQSIFRSVGSVFTSYDSPSQLFLTDADDLAEFIPEFGGIDIKEVADDFAKVSLNSKKLATLLRLSNEFIADAAFDLENYLVQRLAKSFALAEDKSFVVGTGTNEPIGILHNTKGADVAVATSEVSYDDIVKLYFSVKPQYRSNAVWLMNDETALAIRKIKDADGNYPWCDRDHTVLGKKVIICEHMPNAIAGAKPIAFGDFTYYWIVKRSPISVRILKELFALRGHTGYLAFEFIDGKLIRLDAVKVIQMNTELVG